MKREFAHRVLQDTASAWRFRVHAVVLWVVVLVLPVLAQLPEQPPTEYRNSATTHHRGERPVAGASMPDAPSEVRHAPADPGPVTFQGGSKGDTTLVFRQENEARQWLTAGTTQGSSAFGVSAPSADSYANPYVPHVSRRALADSIRLGVASLDGESSTYHYSADRGLFSRAQHALLETFTSQTSGGVRIPAFSALVGAYGAAFLTNTWYPDPRASFALQRGTAALGSSLGLNLVQELVPHKYFKVLHIRDPRETARH